METQLYKALTAAGIPDSVASPHTRTEFSAKHFQLKIINFRHLA